MPQGPDAHEAVCVAWTGPWRAGCLHLGACQVSAVSIPVFKNKEERPLPLEMSDTLYWQSKTSYHW